MTLSKCLSFLGLGVSNSKKIFEWAVSQGHSDSDHLRFWMMGGMSFWKSGLEDGCFFFYLPGRILADELVVTLVWDMEHQNGYPQQTSVL